jgi:PII-like signaling protein
VVDHLHGHGLSGAMVLLGVDGMAHARRERARFFSGNDAVPLMIVCVGSGELIARALPGLGALLADPIVTLERVRVCKRGGVLLAEPRLLPEQDDEGLGLWQKLTIYASERSRHRGHPLYIELIRRLREGGARGATSVRGIWGFSDDGPPHGDRLFAVRRRVPVLTTVVDRPERIRRWFQIVDEVTDEAGLVTSEMVPAVRAVAPGRQFGGLRLASLHD